jgi:hypothetical protein
MDETNMPGTRQLSCECGSEEVCICYSAPIFVYLIEGKVFKVVVDDEDTKFGGIVRCLKCDRFWVIDEEPEIGVWPGWQFGR